MVAHDGCSHGCDGRIDRPLVQDHMESLPPPNAIDLFRPSVGPSRRRVTFQVEHVDDPVPDRLTFKGLIDGNCLHEVRLPTMRGSDRLAQHPDGWPSPREEACSSLSCSWLGEVVGGVDAGGSATRPGFMACRTPSIRVQSCSVKGIGTAGSPFCRLREGAEKLPVARGRAE